MNKFTPGPWHIGMRGGHNANCIYAYNGKDAHDDYVICSVYGINMNRSVDETLNNDGTPNARLIAAAPELLAALIMLRDEFGRLPHSLGYSITHLPKIDAAIEKATK